MTQNQYAEQLVEQLEGLLTTEQVAEYLTATTGKPIKAASVKNKTDRAGIKPVGREAGSAGQSLFKAAAIYAEWPPAPAQDGATFTPARIRRETTVEISNLVSGIDRYDMANGQTLRPDRITGTWVNHHDGKGWTCGLVVHGPRIRQDGTLGVVCDEYMWDHRPAPAWVSWWERDNAPAALPEFPGNDVIFRDGAR